MNWLPGTTPLSPDEQEGLVPSLATQDELNQWERENILAARVWALNPRQIKKRDPFTEPVIRELHRRMFSETWKWAGTYRRSEKNLGVAAHEIRERIAVLLGDVRYWVEHQTYGIDEIALRSHHELVVIHPFANGNGRHARLFADIVAVKLGAAEFSWGRNTMIAAGSVRQAYLQALHQADRRDVRKLLQFARS
jgi:Fic-DOC domain mobile mystery protein B